MQTSEITEVTIIGAGGLGVSAAWGLVSNWPKNKNLNLKIYDADCIEISNLNRQILFGKDDIGKYKAEVLTKRLSELYSNQNIKISNHNFNINRDNIAKNLENSHFVLDATDSVNTKFLINDFCIVQQIPFCYAGSVRTSGQLLLVNPKEENNGCLRCLFGDFSEEEFLCQDASCQQDGIFGPTVGFIGALQANYLIEFLNQFAVEVPLTVDVPPAVDVPSFLCKEGSLFHSFELTSMHQHVSKVMPRADCPLGCQVKKNTILDLSAYKCPKTFLYTKLALEEMSDKEVLDLRFSSEQSINNVILSTAEEGHRKLTEKQEIAANLWRVLIQRGN